MVVLTVGVYAVLWGKHVDDEGEETRPEDNVLEAVKCCSGISGLARMPKIDEANEDIETGKVTAEKESSVPEVVVVVFCSENVNNVSQAN